MLYYTAPSESYPMSFENAQELASLADQIEMMQSAISAKPVRKIAQRDCVTSEDVAALYRKEVRLMFHNPAVSQLIHYTRIHLAQPLSNAFYKDPETGFGDKGEDEE